MNKRLFWKILIVFWLVFYITFQLTWIAFNFYLDKQNQQTFYHIPTKVEMIAQLLHILGKDEAERFIANLPEVERGYFVILKLNSDLEENIQFVSDEIEDGVFLYQQFTTSPSGDSYLVSFRDDADNNNYSSSTIFYMPVPMFLMGIAGGFLFSFFSAWNLNRPVKLLRNGFRLVSKGDLSVRLYDKLKGRRDEISELAQDFDSMVEQLHLLLSARQALLHDISHELRTPLARLQLAIGLASQNSQNIDTALDRIELESNRLDKLIGEILTYSNAEMDNDMNNYFDIKDLLAIIVSDANNEAIHQGITIKLAVDHHVKHSIIKGNAEQIRRAVDNIIRNSIRFSNENQCVDVVLEEKGKYLQLQIGDYGPGVEAHKLATIFEPLLRIQSPQFGKSYGLGLAIARQAVAMHGGIIEAKNREGGKCGLIITINLPYWDQA